MEKAIFDAKLKRLSVLVGREAGTELFNASYEELLNEVRALPDNDQRRSYAERLSKLLMLQLQYAMNAYLMAGARVAQ